MNVFDGYDSSGGRDGFARSVSALAREAADPATTPERMRELIAADPSLQAIVAVNPSVDDPLREWLWQYGGDDVRKAIVDQYEQALAAQQSSGATVPIDDVALDPGYEQPAAQEYHGQGYQAQGYRDQPAPDPQQRVDPQAQPAQGYQVPGQGYQAPAWGDEPEAATSGPVIDAVPGLDLPQEQPVWGAPQPQSPAFAPADPPVVPAQSVPGQGITGPGVRGPQRSVGASEASSGIDDDAEKTVLVRRDRRPATGLRLENGETVPVTASLVLLGRNPRPDDVPPHAQVVRIPDPRKTVSKLHARLEWVDGQWLITDLESTNGIALYVDGVETEIAPNQPVPVRDDFVLGLYRVGLNVDAQHAG